MAAVANAVLALLMLVVGYLIGSWLRDRAGGTSLMVFWSPAAALAGPVLGAGVVAVLVAWASGQDLIAMLRVSRV